MKQNMIFELVWAHLTVPIWQQNLQKFSIVFQKPINKYKNQPINQYQINQLIN